ncbi:MAG: TIGR03560 family F420-dependent LLM class oxidoreductase [Nitrosopumilus sp.]|nr:TIGR03560 family F420-dependent LLM class oxidoreductase [Nitrosopumilus sp.]
MASNQNSNRLQFGLSIPQGWRGGDLPLENENDPVRQHEFSKTIATLADSLGFDSIYAYDHFIPHHGGDMDKNILECITLLTATAAITKRIRIGQVVICNSYRHPSLLAKMLSTLDIISNGRMELGMGAGWYEQEYTAYGYVFPSNAARIKQLDESLSIIKTMWTEPYANFQGQHYTIKKAICNPKPIQKPCPTIMVGGSGEKYLLKVVAKHADRYNLFFGSPKEMKRKISILKDYCNSTDRKNQDDIQYSVVLPCIVRETDEEVNQVLMQHKRKDKTMKQYKEYLVNGIAIGTPERILKGINEYVEMGVTHFILHFIGIDQGSLRIFDSKIINQI